MPFWKCLDIKSWSVCFSWNVQDHACIPQKPQFMATFCLSRIFREVRKGRTKFRFRNK